MKISIIEAKNIQEAYNKIKNDKLPLKLSYNFTKALREVKEDIDYYNTEYRKIIEEFGIKGEDGNYIYEALSDGSLSLSVTDVEKCGLKIDELNELSVDFNIEPISLTDFGMLSIEPDIVEKLFPILKKEQELPEPSNLLDSGSFMSNMMPPINEITNLEEAKTEE